MITSNAELSRGTANELQRVIEPLASYICATDQPRAALKSALAVLFTEVEELTRVANAQFSANHVAA